MRQDAEIKGLTVVGEYSRFKLLLHAEGRMGRVRYPASLGSGFANSNDMTQTIYMEEFQL